LEVTTHSAGVNPAYRVTSEVRGKQVSPPAPFRKVVFGRRLEVTTHSAGVNPAYLVALGSTVLVEQGHLELGLGVYQSGDADADQPDGAGLDVGLLEG
jgi:hypothetical protein